MNDLVKDEGVMNSGVHRTLWVLFAGGVILHITYLFLLARLLPWETWNWAHADTSTYLEPAQSFLETGTFVHQGQPDYTRTVGYPALLAAAQSLARLVGIDQRWIIYLMQALLLALAYPAVYYLGRTVVGLEHRWALAALAISLVFGPPVAYVPIVLSDALFTVLLLTGMACGFAALAKRSWTWSLVHILLITGAALVRPLLIVYPFAATGMHIAFLRTQAQCPQSGARKRIVTMFLLTLMGTQLPFIRVFIHHRIYTASELGSINIYEYLGKEALTLAGKGDRFLAVDKLLQERGLSDVLANRIRVRREQSFLVYKSVPSAVLIMAGHNLILNTLEPHWNNTLFFLFRTTWMDSYGDVVHSFYPLIVAVVFIALYGMLYTAAFLWLVMRCRSLLAIGSLLLFLLPYAISATSYQGARFRLWFEPLVILCAAAATERVWSAGVFRQAPRRPQHP